jgi:CheY-like chemotaxis protein
MCMYSYGVMIVDDNEADVETTTRGLLALDPPPRVVVFRTAGEALEALHTLAEPCNANAPFVILVEANLPLVSGLEIVACMRCDPNLSRIPVFVLTGSSSDYNQSAAHDLGVAGYLRKPATLGESNTVATRIEAYMRSRYFSDRPRQAKYSRAHVACLPHRVADPVPASRRRRIATNAG